ncbi:WxL protein peptidoglycan domain-containing protein [Actinokineospora sp. HUAS TT18]|uniref:WxL protein peptidoglycan domain-containing protein n=1 Tax=Actinokineospora sp. HUAS TT18 TaxID=3447451 RepID=UPI003F521DFB
MKRIWRHTVLSGLLAALAVGVFPTSAHAAQPAPSAPAAPAQQGKGPATFGVRPATAEKPDNRPNFSYSATPGAVIKDHLAVANISNDPLTLKIYASDAFNTPDGGYDLLDAGRKPTDVGAWAKIAVESVEVPGRTTKIVPFSITIPADATPGDHAGGVVAALVTEATGSDGQRVAVEQRVGSRFYLRISGDLKPKLAIEDLESKYRASLFGSGETTVTYTVRNVGNVRLGGKQKVTVETPWGSGTSAENLADLPELLPNNAVRITTTVKGVIPAGWLDSLVHIDPVAPPGPQPQAEAVDASVTVIAVPWLLVIILAVVLLLVLFLLWRRKRKRSRPGPVEPQPLPEVENAVA